MAPQPTHDLSALLAHAGWARALASQLVRDPAAADDLTQEAWLAAVERPPARDRPIRRWLAAVLRNLARESFRSQARRLVRERAAAADEALDSGAELAARLDSHRRLVEAVTRLDEPYRATVILRYFEEHPPREIARIQGVPVTTVNTRLQRALARLRAALDQDHGGNRTAWVTALLPLARPDPLPAALVPALLLMNTKLLLAAGMAAAVVLAWFALSTGGSSPASDAALLPGAAVRGEVAARPKEPGGREGERIPVASGPSLPAASAPAAGGASDREPEVAVRGRVIDVAGRPVPRVTVRMARTRAGAHVGADPAAPAGEGPIEATTDGQGEFQLPAARAYGALTVATEPWITVLAGTLPRSPERRTVLVVAPRMAVAGLAQDEAGQLLADVALSLRLPADLRARLREVLDDSVDQSWQVRSDPQGRFRFDALPVVPGALVHAERAGYETRDTPAPEASTPNHVITLRRTHAPQGAITGTVLDAEGHPAAGALVSWGRESVAADDAGRFHLIAPAGQRVTVMAVRAGSLPASATVDLPAKGAPPEPLVLRLGGPPLTISGRVLDAHGQPLRRATVWAEPTWFGTQAGSMLPAESLVARGGWSSLEETDGEGSFEIQHLLARDYAVFALDPRTLQVARRDGVAAGATGVQLTLPVGGLVERIAGRVVDQRGAPVVGVRVATQRDAWCMVCPAVSGMSGSMSNDVSGPATHTDASGRFALAQIAREAVTLDVSDAAIVPVSIEVSAAADLEHLEIAVARRCHFKVELRDRAEADAFALLDGAGQVVHLTVRKGNTSTGDTRGRLTDGRSEMTSAAETARVLVLYRGQDEVRRVAIELTAGTPTILQP